MPLDPLGPLFTAARADPGHFHPSFNPWAHPFRSFECLIECPLISLNCLVVVAVCGERDAQLAQRVRGFRIDPVPADPHHGSLEPESGVFLPVGHLLHR